MNGTLTQMIALVSAIHGTMDGQRYDTRELMQKPSFSYCSRIVFIDELDVNRPDSREPEDLSHWLASLIDDRVQNARLAYVGSDETIAPDHHAPDHQLAAFANGGGTWQIVLSFPDRSEQWTSRWVVKKPGFFADRSRIWEVTYRISARSELVNAPPPARLSEAKTRLRLALDRIHAFATKHALSIWAETFDRARKVLEGTTEQNSGNETFFVYPNCCPRDARQLFSAASAAWVFGGMGSWNDLGFDPESEHREYEELSAELYQAILFAIQQGSNAFGSEA
ncbi:hypothetical protein [Stieleria varia]|uniref:Uncharacterized protein n=1 Tax=Stieleria varia TaxID=2528005 RepID=A0A5C6ARA3_9BACT|nr:hypothetical protein [Stieleria varia]TWU02563.1 hypothetical protein Pla52n_36130 [Stieleria varia]